MRHVTAQVLVLSLDAIIATGMQILKLLLMCKVQGEGGKLLYMILLCGQVHLTIRVLGVPHLGIR